MKNNVVVWVEQQNIIAKNLRNLESSIKQIPTEICLKDVDKNFLKMEHL